MLYLTFRHEYGIQIDFESLSIHVFILLLLYSDQFPITNKLQRYVGPKKGQNGQNEIFPGTFTGLFHI